MLFALFTLSLTFSNQIDVSQVNGAQDSTYLTNQFEKLPERQETQEGENKPFLEVEKESTPQTPLQEQTTLKPPILSRETASDTPSLPSSRADRAKIEQIVIREAGERGVDKELALFIVEQESNFNPQALGDTHLTCKETGKPIRSRGLWQWADCFHPQITDEQAFDPIISTELAMNELQKGRQRCLELWTTCRMYYGITRR